MNEFANLNHMDMDVTVDEIAYIYHKKRDYGFRLSKAEREYYTVAFVLAGCVEYSFSKEKCIVKAGDILFLDKSVSYVAQVVSKEPWEHIVIAFKGDNMETLPVQTVHKTLHSNRFKELFWEAQDTWSACGAAYKIRTKAVITRILYELSLESISRFQGNNTMLKKATDHIEKNYAQKVTIEELAELSGYSASHFTREFRNAYGVSPIQYLNHIRITHAKNLIKAGQHTITQIARECGFSNVYYFSSYFKKVTGVSPKDY